MNVRQYYYTSYVNTSTGHSGFQIKAMSPDIPLALQTTLARLISYRIPPSLDLHAVNMHPVALRFYHEGNGQCILLCCQSCGSDEYGRPGNFFAHVLILEPDIFTHIPPILFWKSPFWQRNDPVARDTITSLPALPSFAVQPSLAVEQVWNFIAQHDGYQFLYRLLCALISSSKTQRHIIILDSCEHVAMWIAAISCLLPAQYRPFLTFATYHHDLSQSHYLITGTTRDFLSLSHHDRLSYLVFDPETNQTDPVASSLYADLVTEAARRNSAETLLTSFTTYARRFPPPTGIDERLNHLALYTRLQQSSDHEIVTPEALEVISAVLLSFEVQPTDLYTQEDMTELLHIERALRKALRISHASPLQNCYERVLALLRKCSFPLQQLILEELTHLGRYLLMDRQEVIPHLDVNRLCQLYGEERVIEAINSSTYLSWLATSLSAATPPQLAQIWDYLGCSLQPHALSEALLRPGLSVAASLLQQQDTTQLRPLLRAMLRAMQKQSLAWLQLIVKCSTDRSIFLLAYLYRFMVAPLTLEQRLPYRAIVLPLYPHALEEEVSSDIEAAPPEQRLALIEAWAEYATRHHYSRAIVIQKGLEQLFQGNPRQETAHQQWQMQALQVLENERLAPLPDLIEMRLVLLAFATPLPVHFSPQGLALCRKYQDNIMPGKRERAVIDSILALSSGLISSDQVELIQSVMATLRSEAYRALLRPALSAFFHHDITHETHLHLIQVFFPRSVDLMIMDDFWHLYLDVFATMLHQPAHLCKAIDILDFWFSISSPMFSDSYPMQHFFLLLSTNKRFQWMCLPENHGKLFSRVAASRSWYPSLSLLFVQQRPTFLSVAQHLLAQRRVQKRQRNESISKKIASEKGKQALKAEIEALFMNNDVLKQHQLCSQFYAELSPWQFWLHYWKRFIALFTSHNEDRILTIFSFWFDQAATLAKSSQYIQQEFFLGMPAALEAAKHLPRFQEHAEVILKKARPFPWYHLVAPYFETA